MAVDNQSIYNYSLMAAAMIVWFVFYRFFAFIIELAPIQNFFAPGETTITLAPFILGLGVAAGAFTSVKRYELANQFGLEAVVELRKVVWPNRKDVTGTTTAVLIFIFIVAILLFLFDWIFRLLITLLIK